MDIINIYLLVFQEMIKMSLDDSYNQSQERYQQLLGYVKTLLKRENIVNNTYLFKKMNNSLSVPLYIIAEERNIRGITRNYEEIIDALENSGLAHVINNREVKIIDHPTVKISCRSKDGQRQLQQLLLNKQKKVQISRRQETEEFINLTVIGQNIVWLEKLIQSIDKDIDFERANLMNDIRLGVDRIRKLKFDHAKTKTITGKVNYNLNSPPDVFVRKALESSDSEADEPLGDAKGKSQQRRYKLNGIQKRKVRLNGEDFPSLK